MGSHLPSLLVVEDEVNVGMTLLERLTAERYRVRWTASVRESKELIVKHAFHLALVDIGLPDGDGFDVASLLREKQPSCAIEFLTAMGMPEDRVRGLEFGAEDYIVKPFHLRELVLRIENGLRRRQYALSCEPAESEQVTLGKACIRFSKFEAQTDDGTLHPLTHKECALLRLFVSSRGRVVSRTEILDCVWGQDEYPSARTVDNFIVRLRRLVELNPDEPALIRSIRGVGYRLERG